MENQNNIFKFKRAKKMIGNFEPDDPNEWALLTKPQIGDVTLFVHFHKLWCVEEKPEVEADPDNGIEYQEGVQKIPLCEVYFGFVKDGNFVVERQNNFRDRTDENVNKRLLAQLEVYQSERGYTKDWLNYNADGSAIVPHYYGNDKQEGRRSAMLNMMNIASSSKSLQPLQRMVTGIFNNSKQNNP